MAKRKRKSLQTEQPEVDQDPEAFPEGCYHYQDRNDVPGEIQKYSIFSLYDYGIWMTNDAWFGVTPEPIANKIAEHVSFASPGITDTLIDVFGGAGGNSIAFARSGRWKQIHVIERDDQTLTCAKHNAEVYGVQDLITWHHGDCFEIIKKLRGQQDNPVLFASPPWGGPGYRDDEVFDLTRMQPYNLSDLVTPFQGLTKNIVLYLPRTSDLRQLVKLESNGKSLPIVHYCMEGASKALCVYFGDLSFDHAEDVVMDG